MQTFVTRTRHGRGRQTSRPTLSRFRTPRKSRLFRDGIKGSFVTLCVCVCVCVMVTGVDQATDDKRSWCESANDGAADTHTHTHSIVMSVSVCLSHISKTGPPNQTKFSLHVARVSTCNCTAHVIVCSPCLFPFLFVLCSLFVWAAF